MPKRPVHNVPLAPKPRRHAITTYVVWPRPWGVVFHFGYDPSARRAYALAVHQTGRFAFYTSAWREDPVTAERFNRLAGGTDTRLEGDKALEAWRAATTL